MILDLHCHSVASDDARATVEQYAKWTNALRKKGFHIDGFVLTEHRTFDETDYSAIQDAYDILILKASELDTDAGHFLVYGVSEELRRQFDFKDVRMHAEDLIAACEELGAFAAPAHPGRENTGFVDLMAGRDFSSLIVAEQWNGGSRAWENERSVQLVAERGLKGIAGSDAHFVNGLAKYVTAFDAKISTIDELVHELKYGDFRPMALEDTRFTVTA